VEETKLLASASGANAILVGTPAWFAWLEQATTFAFVGARGRFTARKERRGRTGWYWKAYRKRFGQLRSAYLGKSAELSLERLHQVAATLARPLSTVDAPARPETHPAAPRSDRRRRIAPALPTGTVTFLFTDIAGSTQLWEQYTQEMADALARHDTILREAIAAHAGVVFKTIGDGVCAVFARAADALAAALASQRALLAEAWGPTGPLSVRMALHTGAADLRDGDYAGPPLNRLARILAAGSGGQILLSLATEQLVRDHLPSGVSLHDLGTHHLKGLRHPEQIFQLVGPNLPADFPPLRTDAPAATPAPLPPAQLLATKLYAPATRANLVARPGLTARFAAGVRGKLTLIAAPAGFGKTTLISQWRATPAARDVLVAWVSLDAGDNDPIRFWMYLLTALDAVAPGLAAAPLALLQEPQPPPVEVVVTTVLNALATLRSDAVLILDDYHLIDAPLVHQGLTFLLEHLPPQLHLVIATREDPPLPLTRLRAGGELTELRAADLRFTVDETASFLTEAMGLPLSGAETAALEARTEGWIAGLQLAALALHERVDVASFIAAFAGSNRFIIDYLAEEVLERQAAHLQTFLLQTAILDRLCGPLCDAVLGLATNDQGPRTNVSDTGDLAFVAGRSSFLDSYSQLILDQLERANLFLIPLDDQRHWYRYHHLFAEVLRTRLTSGATVELVATLHRRASAWFAQHGFIVEAVQHALAAADTEQVVELLEQHGALLATRGHTRAVLGWLERLPESLIRVRPLLAALHATVLLWTGQFRAAEARMQDAEQGLQANAGADQRGLILGWIALIRGTLRLYEGDLAGSVALGERALELAPATSVVIRASARGLAARAYLLTGDVTPDMERRITALLVPAQASGSLVSVLNSRTSLARFHVLQGRLHAAAAVYAQVAELVPDTGILQALFGSPSYSVGLGDLLREWNELDAAERHLAQGLDLITQHPLTAYPEVTLWGYTALARLEQARGNSARALDILDECMQLGHTHGFAALLSPRVAARQAEIALSQGNLAAAARWADASGLHADDPLSYPREAEELTLARVLIAQGRSDPTSQHLPEALGLLDRLFAEAKAGGRMGSALEILILRALTVQAQGDGTAALATLEQALSLAESEGYIRVFVDEGAPMAALLHAASARGMAPNYVAKLLAAFPHPAKETRRQGDRDLDNLSGESVSFSPRLPVSLSLVEPLTERELEVLRLIAAGRSNAQIAQALVVAVSTVKAHVNHLFSKLAVTSRTQAIARAQELNLL
jgi:LuxR family maltose regulon positive regulatory protein